MIIEGIHLQYADSLPLRIARYSCDNPYPELESCNLKSVRKQHPGQKSVACGKTRKQPDTGFAFTDTRIPTTGTETKS